MSSRCEKCMHNLGCTEKERLTEMEKEFYDYVVNRSELSKFNTGIFSVNVALICEGYFPIERWEELKHVVS